MKDRPRKKIATNISLETGFWSVIAIALAILLLTGFICT